MQETTSTRATSAWRTVTPGLAPRTPVYGSGRPAFSPPTVLRGRGRIFPAPARGTPHPEFGRSRRARCVPDRAVIRGISRLLANRSRCLLTCARGVRRGPADDLLSSHSERGRRSTIARNASSAFPTRSRAGAYFLSFAAITSRSLPTSLLRSRTASAIFLSLPSVSTAAAA